MSDYTMQVRELIDMATPNMTGYSNARIDASAQLIFNFDYPIWDIDYKPILQRKILRHFFNMEIGLETPELWMFYLETRLHEIMPYYNKLYETVDKQYNWLWDTDLTNHGNTIGDTVSNTDFTGNTTSTGNVTDTKDIDEHRSLDTELNITKGGNEDTALDRDDVTTSNKTDKTVYDRDDNTTANGTNNITDKTSVTSTTDTSGNQADVGKQVYAGKSAESEHLGEDTASVKSDYPQAIIDVNGDYASEGTHTTHEADKGTDMDSSSTTDNTNNQDYTSTVDMDGNTDYTRKQNTSDTTDYTQNATTDFTSKDDTNYSQNQTGNRTWKETDKHDQNDNEWKTRDENNRQATTGNQDVTNSEEVNTTSKKDVWENRTGASGARSLTSMLMEYRQSLINIDMMIIRELRDLFMTVY